jgi:glucan phosphoethanolaminetransferase (alkaline phosphatase superfamily)
MIERIQTVFLFIVALSLVIVLIFPVWKKENIGNRSAISLTSISLTHTEANEVKHNVQTFYIAIFAVIAAGIAIYTIFQYKNRMLQIRLCLLNTLFICAVLGLMVYFTNLAEPWVKVPQYGQFGVSFFAPAVALIFNMLARRAIQKDEKLVRSSERLR